MNFGGPICAEEDYDAFCLAYMFTYRDFEMGTLGLAWTGGQLKFAHSHSHTDTNNQPTTTP